jgi:hypothetical protein
MVLTDEFVHRAIVEAVRRLGWEEEKYINIPIYLYFFTSLLAAGVGGGEVPPINRLSAIRRGFLPMV